MASKGSYAKGVAKREEILTTALEVFARQGYRKASLREISEAVGLTQAGLLHYFGSKEELFAEILRKRDDLDLPRFDADHTFVGSLVETIEHNTTVPGLVHLYSTLSAEATDPTHPGHSFFVERYTTVLGLAEESVRRAQEAGEIPADVDPRMLGRALIAIADGLQIQWLLDDDVDMASIVETVWALLKRTT